MSTNFVQKGDVMTVVSPSGGVSSGDPVLIGSLFGIALHDAAEDADLELGVEGIFTVPADNTIAMAIGDRLFWDATNGWVDKTATAQQAVGLAASAKVAAGTTVDIKLTGSTPAGT
jgi:predicted RecA/RadA family phage recombinase